MKNFVKLKLKKHGYYTNEAYKTIRTNIEFCGNAIHVIAVTSSIPNEGKSEISINLAISFAQTDKKVLFIDADLRKSVLVGKYKPDEEVLGLAHYLTGKATAQDIMVATDMPGLHIVYAGAFPPNPTELLASDQFKAFIKQVRTEFDFIIIDTPPTELVIDSAVIASLCDGLVFVIAAGEISNKLARKVKAQLERTGCPILGAVLNKAEPKNQIYYKKRYGKRYGSYYGQYQEQYASKTEV